MTTITRTITIHEPDAEGLSLILPAEASIDDPTGDDLQLGSAVFTEDHADTARILTDLLAGTGWTLGEELPGGDWTITREVTDAGQLARDIRDEHGMDFDAALNLVRIYLRQDADIDGVQADEDAITEAQEASIRYAISEAQHVSADQILSDLDEAAAQLEAAQGEVCRWTTQRDDLIRKALTAGAPVTDIARWARISRVMVYKIAKR